MQGKEEPVPEIAARLQRVPQTTKQTLSSSKYPKRVSEQFLMCCRWAAERGIATTNADGGMGEHGCVPGMCVTESSNFWSPTSPSTSAQDCPKELEGLPLHSLSHHSCCLTSHETLKFLHEKGLRKTYARCTAWFWSRLSRFSSGAKSQPWRCKQGISTAASDSLPLNLYHQAKGTEPTGRSFYPKLEGREAGNED